MTTVREAFDAMGYKLTASETVCIVTNKNGKFVEQSLEAVADEPVGENRYFSTGTFPKGQRWGKGGRRLDNVDRILEFPFDFDLKDFLNQDKQSILMLSNEEVETYIGFLQKAVEDLFRQINLPIHRLDFTGNGLSAHINIPFHDAEHVKQLKQWHAGIVTRVNAVYGSILADPQVKDAGTRIMRLVPCLNVQMSEDGQIVTRQSRNIYSNPGYIDQARLESAAGVTAWRGAKADIPLDGDMLTAEEQQRIIGLISPHHTFGKKHFMALALSGQLAKARVPERQALNIIGAIAAEDMNPADREKCVHDTYEKIRNGESVLGYQGLKDLVDEETLRDVDQVLETARRRSQPKLVFGEREATSLDDVRLFDPPPVPKEAFYGWHKEWLDIVSVTTSSAPAFHLAASTSLQSAMMGRKISTMYAGDTIFANQFAVVVGRTGNSFKDTAYRRTIQMVENYKKANLANQGMLHHGDFQVIRDFASREALVDTMISTPNVYLFSTEITSLFKNATRESTSTLLDALINVWDSPPEITTNSMRARNDNKGAAQNPYLTIYGGTQPNRMGEYMTETMISSGLGNRLAIFMGLAGERLSQTPPIDFDASVELYERMLSAIRHYPEGTSLKMDAGASKLWDEWFYAIKEEVEELANDMKVRHPVMVQKWALMFAVSDQAAAVEYRHMEAAIAIIDWMWECINLYLASWGVSNERKIEERVVTVLKQRQPMLKSDLTRMVRGKWTYREVTGAIRAMKEAGIVKESIDQRLVSLSWFNEEEGAA